MVDKAIGSLYHIFNCFYIIINYLLQIMEYVLYFVFFANVYYSTSSKKPEYTYSEYKRYDPYSNKDYKPKFDRDSKPPHEYTKVEIPNAFQNRDKIASIAKNAVGVYISLKL